MVNAFTRCPSTFTFIARSGDNSDGEISLIASIAESLNRSVISSTAAARFSAHMIDRTQSLSIKTPPFRLVRSNGVISITCRVEGHQELHQIVFGILPDEVVERGRVVAFGGQAPVRRYDAMIGGDDARRINATGHSSISLG